MMKTYFLLLFFIIFIKYVKSQKAIRSYVVVSNKTSTKGFIHEMSVLDATEQRILYRIKTSVSDIDTIIVVDHKTKNIVANLEGRWVEGVFNVTFAIYDSKLLKWTDGIINKVDRTIGDTDYTMEYNKIRLNTDRRWYSKKVKIYYTPTKEQVARFRIRYRWFNWSPVKYDLKIYINKVPDMVYFFLLAIMEHRGLSDE